MVGMSAQAQPVVKMSGAISYSHTASTAVLSVERIDNLDVTQGITSDLRLQLWALPVPYTSINQVGYAQRGHLMASYDLGPLSLGFYFWNVDSGSVPFSPPPPGTWSVALLLVDFNGGFHNASGDLPTDFRNFPAEVFASAVPLPAKASATAVTPEVGMWWNPGESGTGYGIDYSNGTLVVTVYSYNPNGAPQWYYVAGPLDGATFTGTLDKYVSGQCISCSYSGRPSIIGNDGVITINFTSSTTATVSLPGGRVTQIQRTVF
jgi:hypothetical protein